MNFLDKEVSWFNVAVDDEKEPKPSEFVTIKEYLLRIKGERFRGLAEYARGLQEKEYKTFKKNNVPGVTLSARCDVRLKDNFSINQHSGLLQVDFDKQQPDALIELREKIIKDKYIFFCFLSLSARGLKCAIKINPEKHLESFLAAEEYFKDKYKVKIDKAVKDVCRLCFVSYDPDVYINEDSELFPAEQAQTQLKTHPKLPPPLTPDKKPSMPGDIIAGMFRRAQDGTRHYLRLAAGRLAGGYVAGGLMTAEEAFDVLFSSSDSVADSGETSVPERKTLIDAFEYGKKEPISKITSEHRALAGDSVVFWYEDEKLKLCVNLLELFRYVENIGYKNILLSKNELQRSLVKIQTKIVVPADEKKVINDVMEYVRTLRGSISESHNVSSLEELLLKRIVGIITIERIQAHLNPRPLNWIRDTKEKTYLFFKNCYLEITKEDVSAKNYNDLSGYIWQSQIIQKNVDISVFKKSSFELFCENICKRPNMAVPRAEWEVDLERYAALRTVLGYLVNNYKDSSRQVAVILTESSLEDTPEGRTGKSLLLKAVGHIRKMALIDGKLLNMDNPFFLSGVTDDTQIIHFNDCNKGFDFERIFSLITEGVRIEKKHEDSVVLDHETAPKIAISTNYSIKTDSGSAKARRYEMELYCYYSEKYVPIDDFKTEFFGSDWNLSDWNDFFMFLVTCTQEFLRYGLYKYSSQTIEEKRLITKTSKNFVEFADNLPVNEKRTISATYDKYITESGVSIFKYSKILFKRDLESYCKSRGLELINTHIADGGCVSRGFIIQRKDLPNA